MLQVEDVENIIPENDADGTEEILTSCGFENVQVFTVEREVGFPTFNDFRNFVKGSLQFKIPSEDIDNYIEDLIVQVLQENGRVGHNDKVLTTRYKSLVGYGRKKITIKKDNTSVRWGKLFRSFRSARNSEN